MSEPYRPVIEAAKGVDAATAANIAARSYAYYDKQGITQELVREPLPLGGGYGFRWAFYQHGKEIKRP